MIMQWTKQEVFRLLKNKPGTMYQECSDADKSLFRDWLRNLLHTTSVKIDFVKADGSPRQMQCTLNWDMIPQNKQPISRPLAEDTVGSRDPEVLKVFDLEVGEWRSFRFDRLRSIGVTIGMEE